MGVLKQGAERISERLAASQVAGFDPTIILQILPSLLGLFASCKKKPDPPKPPASVDTDEKRATWENAYGLKCEAGDAWISDANRYNSATVNRVGNEIKRDKKADGEKITKREKRQLAIAALDEARSMTHEQIYEASLEAQSIELV